MILQKEDRDICLIEGCDRRMFREGHPFCLNRKPKEGGRGKGWKGRRVTGWEGCRDDRRRETGRRTHRSQLIAFLPASDGEPKNQCRRR